MQAEYLENTDLYDTIIQKHLINARLTVDIATANIKDTRIQRKKRSVSITRLFEDLISKGVSIRILHAGKPSKPFQKHIQKTVLRTHPRFLMRQCPRLHFKSILIDGKYLYLGSANLTGAGLGMKSEINRNFEIGFLHTSTELISEVSKFFNLIWDGEFCQECGRRSICPKPIK